MCPPGWTKLPNEVVDALPTIGLAAFAVLGVLLRLSGRDGSAWPSIGRLADMTGLSGRSVRRGLRVLEVAGLVEIRPRRDGSQRLSNTYRVGDTTPDPRTETTGSADRNDRECGQKRQAPPDKNDGDPLTQAPGYSDLRTQTQGLRKGRGSAARLEVEIPESLRTDGFEAVWQEWLAYRREGRLTMSKLTLGRQLARLAKMGPTRAVATIDHTIEKGWQGLVEPGADNGHAKRALAVGPGQRHPADRRETPGSF